MRGINWILVGMIIGLYLFNIYLITENKTIKKENKDLKDENQYLQWQLNEVPLIVESYRSEICKENNE